MQERFDEYFFMMAKETGGIEGLLNSMFDFLFRRTDFYYECDPGDKMGFPPNVALNMVANIFKKYQDEYYKKHQKKSVEEYKSKLQIYQQKQKQEQEKQQQQLQEQQQKQQLQQQQQQQQQQQPIQQQQQQKKEQDDNQPQSTPNQKKTQEYFNTYNGGTTDKYSWSQSGTDVVVGIQLPPDANKKNLKVKITATNLFVQFKDEVILDGKLYDKVKCDESIWSIEDSQLTITLEKGQDNIWKTILIGDQEIDATKVENTKPLESFDPETQGAIRKIMYEQQRKQMGLPTTEEESQVEMLKKAWDAEGSPFKGQPFDPSKFDCKNGMINF